MIRKSTNELLIKPKMSPKARLAVYAGGFVLTIGALSAAYFIGVNQGHKRIDKDRALIAQLNASQAELRQKLAAAEQNLIIAQRHQQIQEEAYNQINNAYASSEEKNRYLGSRLDFYRSIISPEDGQSGPAIQALTAEIKDDRLQFEVTLVQAIKHKVQVMGNLKVVLLDNDQVIGEWPENSTRSVNFQYFQQISGAIETDVIPPDAKLSVSVTLQDGNVMQGEYDVEQVLTSMSAVAGSNITGQ
jgi:hypothetical protein